MNRLLRIVSRAAPSFCLLACSADDATLHPSGSSSAANASGSSSSTVSTAGGSSGNGGSTAAAGATTTATNGGAGSTATGGAAGGGGSTSNADASLDVEAVTEASSSDRSAGGDAPTGSAGC